MSFIQLARARISSVVIGLAGGLVLAFPAVAENPRVAPDGWSSGPVWRPPGAQTTGALRRPYPGPGDGGTSAAPAAVPIKPGQIERGNLAPVMAGDGSALPYDLWAGLDATEIEKLLAALTIPPRSPALHNLWRRLITSEAAPPGGAGNGHFQALRLEALYRSGLLAEIAKLLGARPLAEDDPVIAMLSARSEIGLGRRATGCDIARRMSNIPREIPKVLRGEAILVAGYCAAADGNAPAAGLLAALAREEGVANAPGLAALDALSLGLKPEPPAAAGKEALSLVDYRILELAGGPPDTERLVGTATPALLAAIVADGAAPPLQRLAAGEAAARLNAIDPAALGQLYRDLASSRQAGDTLAQSAAGTTSGAESPARRALLFAQAEGERTPFKRVRLIRTLLDSARQAGLYAPTLTLAAGLSDTVGLVPEVGWFAETAIESYLGAGEFEKARRWIRFAASLEAGRKGLSHWMALADIADQNFTETRGSSLPEVERLAFNGQFSPDLLHRLATVLDALEYQVPIPLWELASRTLQPAGGHLPETGVLTRLQTAAKERAFGRTVLLAMQALGPNGAEGAHMIALGNSIRALKRAGLEADARRLGLEALLGGWPRSTLQ